MKEQPVLMFTPQRSADVPIGNASGALRIVPTNLRDSPASTVVPLAVSSPAMDVGADRERDVSLPREDVPRGLAVASAPPGLPTRDWRNHYPTSAVSWSLRMGRWLRDQTRAGRFEAECDLWIAASMATMATGCRVVATVSPKGGPGRTTVALTAGLVLAEAPRARPIVVELNADWGTVDAVLPDTNPRTVRDLLEHLTAVERAGISLLQAFVTMWGRLPVLVAPCQPSEMLRLAPRDYARVLRVLAFHYNVIILDCGAAFTGPLMQFALAVADHLLVVGWPDGATMGKAVAAIDYLTSRRYPHDYGGVLRDLLPNGGEPRVRTPGEITLVVNGVGFAPGPDPVAFARVQAALPALNAVVALPYSPPLRRMLAEGALTFDALPPDYRRAAKSLLVALLGRLAQS